MRRLALLVLAGAVTACPPSLDYEGAKCDPEHACPSPLACIDGRCRTELPDSGTDAGSMDAGQTDSGMSDGGPPDAGPVDAGERDAGADGGGTDDAGAPFGVVTFPLGGVVSVAIVLDQGARRLFAATDGGWVHDLRLGDAGLSEITAAQITASRLRACSEGDGGQTLLAMQAGQQAARYAGLPLIAREIHTGFDGVCVDIDDAPPDDVVTLYNSGTGYNITAYLRTPIGTSPSYHYVEMEVATAVLAAAKPSGTGATAWASRPNDYRRYDVTLTTVQNGAATTGPPALFATGPVFGAQALLTEAPFGGLSLRDAVTGNDPTLVSTDGGYQSPLDAGHVIAGELTPDASYLAQPGNFQLAVVNGEGVLGIQLAEKVATSYPAAGTLLYPGPASCLAWGDLDGDGRAELAIGTSSGVVVLRGR